MKQEIVRDERLGEEYLRVEHPSGLTMLLYPMKGFSTSFAMFSTKYGSTDTCFKTAEDEDFVSVPAGVAHYLEHKMFESEDGDAFERYAKTGASANAFTRPPICLLVRTSSGSRLKFCWILLPTRTSPRKRWKRNRELFPRKSECTMTTRAGG